MSLTFLGNLMLHSMGVGKRTVYASMNVVLHSKALRAGLDFRSTFVEKSKQFRHICVFESIFYLNVSLIKYPDTLYNVKSFKWLFYSCVSKLL